MPNGLLVSGTEMRYYPYGEVRLRSGDPQTQRQFTDQYLDGATGLMYYSDGSGYGRYYEPRTGRWLQPDPQVPNPGNPQDLNRYAYTRNNPLVHIDDGGKLPVVPILLGLAVLKAIDYGWTAYDTYQSLKVLNAPNASEGAKQEAATNLALTAAFEAAEPDEMFPVGLPLDDLARKAAMAGIAKKAGKEAVKETVEERLKRLPTQTHHILTTKHSGKWTAEFKKIIEPYGLNLDEAWNKIDIPHRGRHPEAYHEWLRRQVLDIDAVAQGDRGKFLRLFNERIKQPLQEHPEMLFKDWWQ